MGKFKRYVVAFVINGNSMVNHWENSNGIFHHSLLMGDQWNMTGNILLVLIMYLKFVHMNEIYKKLTTIK